MGGLCNRNEDTGAVSVPSVGSQELVERFKQKFIREARLIASMRHPGVVSVISVFEENGTAYYVMEHVEGGSLADLVRQNGPRPEAEALGYIRQSGEALSYIHGLNTLHLDVKPANILVDRGGRTVLIDFGVSKHYDETGTQTSSTPVAVSHGFAPIEQMRGGDVAEMRPATDVYALGATLWFLLTGEVPPDASDLVAEPLERPAAIHSDAIWAAIRQAMQPSWRQRQQSVAEFLSQLGAAPASAPSSGLEPAPKPAPSPVAEETTLDATAPARKPTPRKPAAEKKTVKLWLILLLVLLFIAGVGVSVWLLTRNGKEEVGQEEAIPEKAVQDEPVQDEPATVSLLEEVVKRYGEDLILGRMDHQEVLETCGDVSIWHYVSDMLIINQESEDFNAFCEAVNLIIDRDDFFELKSDLMGQRVRRARRLSHRFRRVAVNDLGLRLQ